MSIINIVHHDENIYSVAAKECAAVEKLPRHHSKFEKMVREERQAALSHHKTMGFAEVPLHCPRHFLRKDCGVRCQVPSSPKQCLLPSRKPPVPKKKDLCGCNSPCKKSFECKNFKKENIKCVVSATPKRPKPKFCDTRKGDFHDLERSGLAPVYVYSKKYGKCPGYIVKKRHEQIQKEMNARNEELEKQPKCRYISPEERAKLLGGLKENWEELQKSYQALPLMIDTIPKMLRKTKLENKLKALERDILNIENNPYIYIYDE